MHFEMIYGYINKSHLSFGAIDALQVKHRKSIVFLTYKFASTSNAYGNSLTVFSKV